MTKKAVIVLAMALVATPAGAVSLKAFCTIQNNLCKNPGCIVNPGLRGIKSCQEQVCGARLVSCLQTGCYTWRTKDPQCYGSGGGG